MDAEIFYLQVQIYGSFKTRQSGGAATIHKDFGLLPHMRYQQQKHKPYSSIVGTIQFNNCKNAKLIER